MNGTILLRNISVYLTEFMVPLKGIKLPALFVVKENHKTSVQKGVLLSVGYDVVAKFHLHLTTFDLYSCTNKCVSSLKSTFFQSLKVYDQYFLTCAKLFSSFSELEIVFSLALLPYNQLSKAFSVQLRYSIHHHNPINPFEGLCK